MDMDFSQECRLCGTDCTQFVDLMRKSAFRTWIDKTLNIQVIFFLQFFKPMLNLNVFSRCRLIQKMKSQHLSATYATKTSGNGSPSAPSSRKSKRVLKCWQKMLVPPNQNQQEKRKDSSRDSMIISSKINLLL